jgi:hypothetical protein
VSPWAWLGLILVALVSLGVLAFITGAVVAAVHDAQRRGRQCPRGGHPAGEPWPLPDPLDRA